MKKRILNSETVFGLIIALVSLFFIIESRKFPPGTSDGVPGPGYFPTIAAVMVLLFSVAMMIKGYINPHIYFILPGGKKDTLIQMFMVIGNVMLFLIIWQFVPFIIAAAVMVFLMCLIFRQKIRFSIAYTAILVGALYFIFSVAFRVSLDII